MRKTTWYLTALFLLASLAYSNHFGNSFQFDDYPTITDNPSVRSLSSIPQFFLDPTTASGTANRAGFRPLLLSSMAIDYWIAGGYDPVVFHATSFGLFLLLLIFIFLYMRKEISVGGNPSDFLAFSTTALFAVHPANADCVNYIVQRGEILAALGIIGGLLLYRDSANARKYHLYLLPALFGCLSKEIAYVFPGLIFLHVFVRATDKPLFSLSNFTTSFRAMLPSALLIFSFALFFVYLRIPESTMKGVVSGGISPLKYLATQMYIIPDYIRMVFLPIDLSVDTDWRPVSSFADPNIYVGALSCLILVLIALHSLSNPNTRMIGFGIGWFFICLAPTSSISPLTEVRNNHRLFLPLIGLLPAIIQGLALTLSGTSTVMRRYTLVIPLAILSLGYATYQRNKVWQTPETFWRDIAEKSPYNGRGHMNYGLTFLSKADYPRALSELQEALKYTPYYSTLHVNLGLTLTAMGDIDRGEWHFKEAQRLAPDAESSHYFFGRWLASTAQYPRAIEELQQVLTINPRHRNAALSLLDIFKKLNDITEAKALCGKMARALPSEEIFNLCLRSDDLSSIPLSFSDYRDAPYYIKTTLELYQAKKFNECVHFAQLGFQSFGDSAPLYNNAAVCALEAHNLSDAERFATRALEIDPNYDLAKNNLLLIRTRAANLAGDNAQKSTP